MLRAALLSRTATRQTLLRRQRPCSAAPLRRRHLSRFASLFGDNDDRDAVSRGSGGGDAGGGGPQHYDVAVIGGGSGGMAASFEAARLGLRTVLFDYVEPSPQGSRWDVGGTCVNVGCVPKKLFHAAALQFSSQRHARRMGWLDDRDGGGGGGGGGAVDPAVNWRALVEGTTSQIRALNFSYRTSLAKAGVTLVNAHARFAGDGAGSGSGSSPIELGYAAADPFSRGGGGASAEHRVTATHVIVATGGRPRFPDSVAGAAQHMISSDDIFTLPHPPGRTLCVGGGYISLECAGFLAGLGFEVDIAVRGEVLSGFDRDCAGKVAESLSTHGARFLRRPARPTAVRRHFIHWGTPDEVRKLRVDFDDGRQESYDTVICGTGRQFYNASPEALGVALERDPDGRIVTDDALRTSLPNVFAVGDVVAGHQALTPVAIRNGRAVVRRIAQEQQQQQQQQQQEQQEQQAAPAATTVAAAGVSGERVGSTAVVGLRGKRDAATTVFTPAEYGLVGLSEEQATRQLGVDRVRTYLWQWTSLEAQAAAYAPHPFPLPAAAAALKATKFVEVSRGSRSGSGSGDGPVLATGGGGGGGSGGGSAAALASASLDWASSSGGDDDDDAAAGHTTCFAKLVCDAERDERVVGFHFVGPNAGEVTQGFALAVAKGATKQDFDDLVEIHPTDAEAFCSLEVERRDVQGPQDYTAAGGCGGGKCG